MVVLVRDRPIGTMAADRRIKELEALLSTVQQERDDLQRDVESLCLQQSGSMWSSSYVLSERLSGLEKELSKYKYQLARLTQERDNLKEDIISYKNSKRTADVSYREEKEKGERLEKELAFYQSQGIKAMAERDQAAYEAEALRADNLKLEGDYREAQGKADYELSQRQQLQRQLDSVKSQLEKTRAELEQRAKDCLKITELERKLKATQHELNKSKEEEHNLQGTVKTLQRQIEETKAQVESQRHNNTQLGSALEKAQDSIKALQRTMEGLQATVKQQSDRIAEQEVALQQASAAAAATAAATAQWEAEHALHAQKAKDEALVEVQKQQLELETMRAKLAEKETELQAVAQSKVDALVKLSVIQEQREADAVQLDMTRERVRDLKLRLAQATQDKVAALMQVAAAGGTPKGSPTPQTGSLTPSLASSLAPSRAASDRALAMSPGGGLSARSEGGSGSADVMERMAELQLMAAVYQEQLYNVDRLVVLSERMRRSLEGVAQSFWSNQKAPTGAALKAVSQLQEELDAERARLGVLQRGPDTAGAKQLQAAGEAALVSADRLAAGEVFELLEFGLSSLRQVNKVMAYTQLLQF